MESVRKLIVLFAMVFLVPDARAEDPKPWIFFDLGQTIVDTDTHGYNPMFYMPGAQEYIARVSAAGHPVGLIIDIPADWGKGYSAKDPFTKKWLRTLDFLAGIVKEDGASWKGTAPFDYSPFGKFVGKGKNREFRGRVLLPMTEAQRKDSGSSALFEEAKRLAEAEGAQALYVSETAEHVEAARRVGLAGYALPVGFAAPAYIPLAELTPYVHLDIKKGCTAILDPSPVDGRTVTIPAKRRRVGL